MGEAITDAGAGDASEEDHMVQRAHRTNGQGRRVSVLEPGDVSEITSWDEFEAFVLSHPDHQWELYEGKVREKPWMSAEHNDAMMYLAAILANQLDRRLYRVRSNSTHIRRSSKSYYISDVFVVAAEAFRAQLGRPGRLERYDIPLFLVIELWSRSTGRYDVNTKIPEYQERGDLEIWRLHPYERSLTVWRRQEDGTYQESTYRGGTISPAFLPNVTIDLDALFDYA
jgi:Uma2 family endonuclease